MTARTTLRHFGALLLAGLLAGCSSATAPAALSMSQSDVGQLLAEIDSALAGSGATFARIPSAGPSLGLSYMQLAAAHSPISNVTFAHRSISADNVSESLNCKSGGSVTASGTGTNTPGGNENFDLTTTFNGCRTTHYTVGGSLEFVGNDTFSGSNYNISLTVHGTLNVAVSDGRSGSCPIDFSVTATQSSATVTGTVCGVTANGTVTP